MNAWRDFKGGKWQDRIDVRDFIQKNYTPYTGDESFLQPPTARTEKMLEKYEALCRAEQQNGGVLQTAGTEDIQQAVQQGKTQRQDGIWRYVYLFCQRQEGSLGADIAADAGGIQLTQPPDSPAAGEIAPPHRQVLKGQAVHVDGGNIRFLSGSYVNKHESPFRRSSGADRVVRPYKTR